MKLKNKKTGEIAEASILNFELVVRYDDGRVEKYPLLFDYSNFEHYEEPKEYWYIYGNQVLKNECDGVMEDRFKAIGNYFKTKEEAEKELKKLKAWKRLKDKGLKFELCTGIARGEIKYYLTEESDETEKDLRICFGGEE